ncbi:MAG: UPF0262 family protein [Alphaproteobacteria bacterium]
MGDDGHFLTSVRLADSLPMPPDPDLAHEIRVAIYDLVEENSFRPANGARGPFDLVVGLEESRLVLLIATADGGGEGRLSLPLVSLRRLIKDYGIVCDSYVEAIRSMSPSQIEAIDMGRRGLHNEAGELLRDKLAAHVAVDLATARRLFTLVYALLRRR